MCLILNDYQFKTSIYNNGSTQMNLTVTMKQKPTIDIEKQTKILLKKIIKPQRKKVNAKEQKTSNKFAISMYLLMITLNINAPIKNRVTEIEG